MQPDDLAVMTQGKVNRRETDERLKQRCPAVTITTGSGSKGVERFDAALAALNGSKGSWPRGRERLLPAARARIAATQRSRWVKVRSNVQPKTKSSIATTNFVSRSPQENYATVCRRCRNHTTPSVLEREALQIPPKP
jgi:hypothetical protein